MPGGRGAASAARRGEARRGEARRGAAAARRDGGAGGAGGDGAGVGFTGAVGGGRGGGGGGGNGAVGEEEEAPAAPPPGEASLEECRSRQLEELELVGATFPEATLSGDGTGFVVRQDVGGGLQLAVAFPAATRCARARR